MAVGLSPVLLGTTMSTQNSNPAGHAAAPAEQPLSLLLQSIKGLYQHTMTAGLGSKTNELATAGDSLKKPLSRAL